MLWASKGHHYITLLPAVLHNTRLPLQTSWREMVYGGEGCIYKQLSQIAAGQTHQVITPSIYQICSMLPTMTALLLLWHGHHSAKKEGSSCSLSTSVFLQSMQMIIVSHAAGRVTSSYYAHIKCTSSVYFPISYSEVCGDIVLLRMRTWPLIGSAKHKCCYGCIS